MKKIISLIMIVLLSVIAYTTQASAQEGDAFPKGRVAAVGDEPNGDGQDVQEANQAGVTVLGAGNSQVKVCKNCQQAGNVLLSSSGRIARPGIIQQSNSGSSNNTSSEPAGTGK